MPIILKEDVSLNCPFEEKDAAKALGARWNGKKWYVPAGEDVEKFVRWVDPELMRKLRQSKKPKKAKKSLTESEQNLGKIIQYWRYALEFSNLDKLTEKGICRNVNKAAIDSGDVSDDKNFINKLIEEFRNDKESSPDVDHDIDEEEDWEIPVFILVGIFPKKPQVFFAIPCLLDVSSASLKPNFDELPRFNRQYLEPLLKPYLPLIGTVENASNCFDEIKKPEDSLWKSWWEYADALFEYVTASSLLGFKLKKTTQPVQFKLVYPKSNDGATLYIKSLINFLLDNKHYQQAALFKKIAVGERANPALNFGKLWECFLQHTGHMDQRNDNNGRIVYPLDSSQRTALGHFLLTKQGGLLAVDGPPGTGKTSLMRDVIASEWVNATVASENPVCPIIIASAATNQAVTNIISSFDKVADRFGKITVASRWLSDLVSYGWYLPSKSQESEDKWANYQLLCKRKSGFVINNQAVGIEDKNKSQLKAEFVQNFMSVFPNEAESDLKAIAAFLHQQLKEVACSKQLLLNEMFAKILKILCQHSYTQLKMAGSEYETFTQQAAQFEKVAQGKLQEIKKQSSIVIEKLRIIKKLIIALANLDKAGSFLKRLISFFFKGNRDYQLKKVLSDLENYGLVENAGKYSSVELLNLLSKLRTQLENKLDELEGQAEIKDRLCRKNVERYADKKAVLLERVEAYSEFEKFLHLLESVKCTCALTEELYSYNKLLDSLSTQYKIESQSNIDLLMELFQDVLDCTIRTYAFHLTARYWEARWLLEDALPILGVSENDILNQIRRYCMLAPCMVSTMHSLPKLFISNLGNTDFILNGADLLIIDEAGQASPEIGVVNFSLAKKAIVVGDVEQLKPVWNFESHEDLHFLDKFGLTAKVAELTKEGYCVSSGSIMMMAHSATQYAQGEDHGILLRGHYRCVPTIIEFCNELVYSGRLIPKRAEEEKALFYPMSFVKCLGVASSRNGSWCNKKEAEEIARWLYEKRDTIESYYQKCHEEKRALSELVGIVTPYSAQIYAIKDAVATVFGEGAANLLKEMTIGTIHSLQGAEKPIVIFSAVSTPEQDTSPFMDSDTDMLNVAVSRAQDCFILVGHPELFFSEAKTENKKLPSVMLGRYMKEHGRRLYPRNIIAVESPSKAKLFESYLGCDYKVIATTGHFRDLDIASEGFDFSQGVKPTWKIDPAKENLLVEFESSLLDADKLIFATDNDREGEAISWHLKEVLSERLPLDNLILERIRFDSIDKETLLNAIAHPEHSLDLLLVRSALARRIIDYLLGKKLTQCVTQQSRLNGNKSDVYSIGRVQAALLYLLKSREEEVAKFNPEAYWKLAVTLKNSEAKIKAYLAESLELLAPEKQFSSKNEAAECMNRVNELFVKFTKRYDEQSITLGNALPMTTAEVLKQANIEFGLTPSETMNALQSLYDGSYENE